MHTFAGTPYCMAPEILKENNKNSIKYTKNIDVWSFGVFIYFLCCKNYPFSSDDFESIYQNIVENIETQDYMENFPSFYSEKLRKFVN